MISDEDHDVFYSDLTPYKIFDWIRPAFKIDSELSKPVSEKWVSHSVEQKPFSVKRNQKTRFGDEHDRIKSKSFNGPSVRKLGWGLKNFDKVFNF